MITILNISDTKFSYNGIAYFKNFTPFVTGNKVSIVNTYDACISLTNFPTIYSDISVDGVTYGSVAALQNALLSVLFSRTSLVDLNGRVPYTGATSNVNLGTNNITANSFIKSGGTSSQYLKADGSVSTLTNPITGTGTTNYLPKFTGSTALGNSLIFDNGSGVGINTTAPNYTTTGRGVIDINGTSQSMLALSVGGVGKSFLFYTGTDLLVSNESNGAIKFNTNGSEKVIITSGGNVGIGTTSPAQKLDVFGTSRISNTTPTQEFYSTGNGDVWGSVKAQASGTGTGASLVFSTKRDGNTATDKMIITQLGSVGIGTSSPSAKFQVYSGASVTDYITFNVGDGSNTLSYIPYVATGDYNSLSYGGGSLLFNTAGSRLTIGTQNGTAIQFGPINTLISGNVLVGTTTNTYVSKLVLDGAIDNNTLECKHTGTGSVYNVIFVNGNGYVGDIRTNGSSTSFNTTSDYRLKEDFKNYSGLNLISKIKTYNYKWKVDESRSYGVIAHELQEVIPQAVSGEKDAEQMQSVDYSKLVPILVQAIQELKQEIQILKN